MRKLTEFLLSGRSSEAGIIPKQYQAVVEAFGGQAGFIDMAYGLVDPWVKSLEGEIITVQRYDAAPQKSPQNNRLTSIIGCMRPTSSKAEMLSRRERTEVISTMSSTVAPLFTGVDTLASPAI